MALLRRVLGDALRARRHGQQRTLREVSTAANVSLGYLSEIERGQKEASSELLASICEALGSQLSEVLREASDSLARAERTGGGLAGRRVAEGQLTDPVRVGPAERDTALAGAELPRVRSGPATAELAPAASAELAPAQLTGEPATPRQIITDGAVSVSVRRDGPLRTTLHATRTRRSGHPVPDRY